MTNQSTKSKSVTPENFLHLEFPKQFARDEFWKQIKRTVGGDPVSQNDIDQIVQQIKTQLNLTSDDHLLDLGCGNGALAAELFPWIDRYTGVDFSEYLLGVAKEFFQPRNHVRYVSADMRDTPAYLPNAMNATKVLIYGCISYLQRDEIAALLSQLRTGLPRLQTIFIGNVADQQHARDFYAARQIQDYSLDDPQSPIGVWWTEADMVDVAVRVGYSATCVRMANEYYASQYRFDLVLHPIR